MGTHVDVEEKTTYDWAYQYGSSHPHAPTKIGRRIYTYDLNGNQLGWTYPPEPEHSAGAATDTATQGTGHVSGPGRHLLWDEENRLQEYETEETETYYTYNDKGERVYKKTEDEDHTFYLNQYYIVRNDAIVSKHLFAGATRIVTRLVEPPEEDSEDAHVDKLYYYHPDHLGSTGYTTNRKGRVNEHHEYFPFGETWIEQEGDSKKPMYLFTGKELDQESGLYYFGARYYDPRTSVWQSADPIDRFRAQSPIIGLNLYQYGLLNPLRYNDPNGKDEGEGIFASILQKYDEVKSSLAEKSVGWFRDMKKASAENFHKRAGDDPETASSAAQEEANAAADLSKAEAKKVIDSTADNSVGGAFGKAIGLVGATFSKINRAIFKSDREKFWKNEAKNNSANYSADDIARMEQGKAPVGSDGFPMELHHADGTMEGELKPMTRTDHRLGDNYKENHPWLSKDGEK